MTAETLRGRLKRYGIGPSREARHAALLALASRLPAPILAERIGIHPATHSAVGPARRRHLCRVRRNTQQCCQIRATGDGSAERVRALVAELDAA